MKKIKPGLSNRIFFVVSGILFMLPGIFLFPKQIIEGFIPILPIVCSLCFILFGLLGIYIGLFYEIRIEDSGISTGSIFYKKKIPKDHIKGYFLTQEPDKARKKTDILVLLLTNGKQKTFDRSSLGKQFLVLKKEVSKQYQQLAPVEKLNYKLWKERRGFKWASIIGLGILFFGAYLLVNSINRNFDFIEVEGTLSQTPTFDHNKHHRVSRVNIKLNEYPRLVFSQVKNAHQFVAWAKQADRNSKI